MTTPVKNETPAAALRQLLIDNELADNTNDGIWACSIGHMPNDNDRLLTVYDTAEDGNNNRLMTGEVVRHHGFQIRARALKYSECWLKLNSISLAVSLLKNQQVTLTRAEGNQTRTTVIEIQSVRFQAILPLGNAGDIKHRHEFTVNGTITARQISSSLS